MLRGKIGSVIGIEDPGNPADLPRRLGLAPDGLTQGERGMEGARGFKGHHVPCHRTAIIIEDDRQPGFAGTAFVVGEQQVQQRVVGLPDGIRRLRFAAIEEVKGLVIGLAACMGQGPRAGASAARCRGRVDSWGRGGPAPWRWPRPSDGSSRSIAGACAKPGLPPAGRGGGASARRVPLSARGVGADAPSPPARYRWTQRRAVRRDRPCCRASAGSGTPSFQEGTDEVKALQAQLRAVSDRSRDYLGLGAARRRVWAQGVGLRMRMMAHTGRQENGGFLAASPLPDFRLLRPEIRVRNTVGKQRQESMNPA